MQLASLALSRVDGAPLGAGPILVNRDPAPGEIDVPLPSAIALEVTTAPAAALDVWATRVWVNDALAFDGSAAAPIAAPYAGSASAWSHTEPVLRVVLAPVTPLASGAAVRLRVVSSTGGGAARIDEAYTFTPEDVAPPRLVAAYATGARTVRLAFDKPVADVATSSFGVQPLGAPAVRGRLSTVSATGVLVDLTLEAPLSPGILYEAWAVGVADARGHAIPLPGDTARFSAFRPPRPDGRKFDLWSMLPKHNRRLDRSGELQRFIGCLQEVTDWLLAELDAVADLPDIERAPEWMVDRILVDLGNPFDLPLSLLEKRRLASMLVSIYKQKGTAPGIKNAIRFFLGLEDVEIAPLAASTLTLGESQLGEDWELGPSARFARYAFELRVGRALTEDERAAIRAIVRYAKPSHTHFAKILEPGAPLTFDHWELGLSQLGSESLLH